MSILDPHHLAPLVSQLSELVHVRNASGDVIWASPSAADLFGWPGIGSGDSATAAGDDADQALDQAGSQGSWQGVLNRLDVRGNALEIESRWSAVRESDGSLAGFLVWELNNEDRRPLDENLLRAQRMESISTLAGGVAHDINNVLGPILIAAEMIRRKTDDPWIEKKMQGIETSARRGAEIVKQVLDFSRGMEGEKIAVQIRHVLKELVEFAGHTFSKSISIEGDFPRDLPPLVGDASQLRQGVLNMMVNARDAMPDGGTLALRCSDIKLTAQEAVALSPHGIEGHYVRIDVQDTGSGIPADVVDRIFEPFFTTKSRGQGSGLGLSTTMSIVQGHGGFIGVSSEQGVGTTFSLFLPVAVNETADTSVVSSVDTSASVAASG
ncbi:MAG: ATP-binding protein, partial [Bacteroidota bacterium]|nr:ATP-binding protein [Bacteroidota bacterium]